MTSEANQDYLLQGRLSREDFKTVARAATAKWEGGPYTSSSSEVDAVVWQRHDNTVRFVVPWLQAQAPLDNARIIDVGCGCGSSSLALSHFAREVIGIEIDLPSVEAFEVRMDTFEATNTRVIPAAPERVLDNCLELMDESSIVLMLAVVEHLTPDEQLAYLSAIWDSLLPGQILAIAETPNFLGLMDTHTFSLPFAHMIQSQQFESWLRKAPPDLRFRDHLLAVADTEGNDALLTERFRLGLGVVPEVFELAFGEDLNEIVVSDGFCEPIVNWFPLISDDHRLLAQFHDLELDLPIGFARSVLSFIFRKPRSQADATSAREWNASRRATVPDVFSGPDTGAAPEMTDGRASRLLYEREAELNALYASRSWRLTKPLRSLGSFARKYRRH